MSTRPSTWSTGAGSTAATRCSRLVLAVLAAGFVLLVMAGMAGYGVLELLTQ